MDLSYLYRQKTTYLLAFCLLSPFAQAENPSKSFAGITFVKIPAGCFQMGSDADIKETGKAELPIHNVCIEKNFYLGATEVTQTQWQNVMGNNPSKFKMPSNPVEQVSWNDVQDFIQKLNARAGGQSFRLPTEAEWEYAARAGSESLFSFGDSEKNLAQYGWYGNEGYGGRTSPVGRKLPNAWGLYDMHGNVWEWVQDWYDGTYYANSPEKDPKGPASGKFKVYRGGSWIAPAKNLRSALRFSGMPISRSRDIGFRLVHVAE